MTDRKLDRRPPEISGDAALDLEQIKEYLERQREEINFILTLIYKRLSEGGL